MVIAVDETCKYDTQHFVEEMKNEMANRLWKLDF